MNQSSVSPASRPSDLRAAISAQQALGSAVAQEQILLEEEQKKIEQMVVDHELVMRNWSCDKEGVLETIRKMGEAISQNENKTRETQEEVRLNEEVVKRLHVRNEEYEPTLESKALEIAERLKARENEDKEMREQLLTFRLACQEREQKYRNQISKLEEQNAQEGVDHQQAVQQLRSKITDVEATLEEEKRAWAQELEMRRLQKLSEGHKCLTEEAAAAGKARDMLAVVMKEASALRLDSNLFASLNDLLCC